MATDTPDLTKTERNLWNAIVGEALAYLKYNAFAHKALEEGHPEVAQVFQEVAGAETIHGMNHLRVAGEIQSTIDNLRNVTEGETKETPRATRQSAEHSHPGGPFRWANTTGATLAHLAGSWKRSVTRGQTSPPSTP